MRFSSGLILSILINHWCLGQLTTASNTSIFRVRAPKSACSVFLEDSVLWLEKLNKVRVKVRGRKTIDVTFKNGKMASSDDEGNYMVKFSSPGITEIVVYERTKFGKKPIYSKQYKVVPPMMYFCGIRQDSSSKVLKFKGDHLYAQSLLSGEKIRVKSFDMVYTVVNLEKLKEKFIFKSDTCLLTDTMRIRLKKFQPNSEEIYFYNIIGVMPDGVKKFLPPIEVLVKADTTSFGKGLSLIYALTGKSLYE